MRSSTDDLGVARPISSKLKRESKTYRQALGAVVTRLRTDKMWSQETLAEKTGYSTAYVIGLEHGRRNPSLEMIQAIAGVFGISPSQLLAQAERKQAKR